MSTLNALPSFHQSNSTKGNQLSKKIWRFRNALIIFKFSKFSNTAVHTIPVIYIQFTINLLLPADKILFLLIICLAFVILIIEYFYYNFNRFLEISYIDSCYRTLNIYVAIIQATLILGLPGEVTRRVILYRQDTYIKL